MRRRVRWFRSLFQAPLVGLLVSAPASAQADAFSTSPVIPHQAVDFFRFPPDIYFGEAMGIATNSQGHVFVYTRASDTRLYEFDQNGNYVREIGAGLYGMEFAHKVRVDSIDNIWVVDEGSNMVIKFNPQGRVEMVIGARPPSADGIQTAAAVERANERYLFARPTDVGWDPQGNIFVSDGYQNHRVVKYSPDGRYLGQFGSGDPGDGPDELNLPHTLAVDRQGRVYVGDRSNERVQVLSNDLRLIGSYTNVGAPWEICVSRGQHQYLFVSNSNSDSNPAASWNTSGEIYKMELDGTILGRFGRAGKMPGEFQTVHGLDCRSDTELYTAEISAWRAQKILLTGPPRPASDR
jgi:DNA-binding beta-propeller fold protein YncE